MKELRGMSTAAPLIDYLKQLEAKGETHVTLDSSARAILRTFYINAVKGGTPTEIQTETEIKAKATAVDEQPQKIIGSGYAEMIASLRSSCEGYAPVRQLESLRNRLVFPQVPLSAEIMFVGESPGYQDERVGVPFSGPAGEKLNGILKAMNLSREQVHVTNILKYRPALPQQTTNNRPATEEELEAAKPLIEQEIRALKPKVIITLGSDAAKFFTGQTCDLDEIRCSSHAYQGIKVIATYHPSFLLHNQDTRDKRALWEDMLKVMELMGMPITERQRGYFLAKEA